MTRGDAGFEEASIHRKIRFLHRWLERPDDHDADAARGTRMDAVFVRTFDALVVWVVSVSYASIALLALDAYDAATAVTAGAVVGAVLWFFTPARFGDAGASRRGGPPRRREDRLGPKTG